jgi:xanthine/uracil permease
MAALADSAGAHHLALNVLLIAVPFAAVAALLSFGEYLDLRSDSFALLQAVLWAASVVLLVLSCDVRRRALHGVPPLAISSMLMCLGIYAVKVAVAVAPHARRAAGLRPAKP